MKKYAGLPDWLTCISLSILVTASNMEVSVLTFIILNQSKNQHGSANSNYFQYDKIASCYIYLFLYFLYYSDPVFLRYK